MIVINEENVRELARIIRKLNYRPISFENPDLFPRHDDFIYPNYVFFMVAIDHSTGFGRIHKTYHGSDLLFYLARRKQIEDPEYFTAENLRDVSVSEVRKIFTYKGVTVANPELRVYLLRDCARKLLDLYNGDINNLFEKAAYYLTNAEGEGVLSRLKLFRAYEDPFMKKSFLLVKILKRGGLKLKDPWNLKFPVDSVLVKIAVSSQIVEPDESIMVKIHSGIKLTDNETAELRESVSKALLMVAEKAETDPDIIDDILWTYGREINSENFKTPLDDRVSKEALEDFLIFVRKRYVKEINFPENWYF